MATTEESGGLGRLLVAVFLAAFVALVAVSLVLPRMHGSIPEGSLLPTLVLAAICLATGPFAWRRIYRHFKATRGD